MLNRRQFLTTVGGGAAVAGLAPLAGCMAPHQRPPLIVPREETWANSICQLCPSHCGVRVRVMNGHPVSVEGNPLHPVNRGGLCVRGAAALQLYYDPDRLPGPMKRDPNVVGGRALASWSEALKKVSSSLQKAVAAGRGRVAVIRGDGNDATSQLLGRLVRASGSDWIVDTKTAGVLAMEEVLRQMYGHDGRIVYDLSRSDFLLSVDSGLLESARDTMNLHRGFAEMRAAGGVFVHAGPRMGVTGSKADEWLPIRPSTGGVLALGVAHMLIKEGYARKEFLREHTAGFDDWTDEAGTTHRGIRAWILSKFSPERVEEITGVGWDRVIRVAREFGSAKAPLAVGSLETTGTLPDRKSVV